MTVVQIYNHEPGSFKWTVTTPNLTVGD